MILLRIILACCISFCLSGVLQQAHAFADDAVGIVLDLQGNGKIVDNGIPKKLQLLSYLKKNSQITLEDGAKASLSLYSTRSTYRFVGPSVIDIASDKVTVVKGGAAVTKSMAEKLVVTAASSNLLTGAIRMRQLPPKIAVLTPENGAFLLNAQPNFSWASLESAKVEIKLQDQAETVIALESSSTGNWVLPSGIALKNGASYRWTVSFVSEKDGNQYSATGEFSIASNDEIASLAKLKPIDDAAIEEWVLYAAMLQSKRVFYEARTAWQFIAKQRPDLEKAKELSR